MSEAVPKGEEVLLKEAVSKFVSTYNRKPLAAAAAPGRVNLIGEHVDYCEGFVLPVALPFFTVVVGAYNSTDECMVLSILASGQEVQTSFSSTESSSLQPGEPGWANYVKGVLANFPEKVKGLDAVIVSDVPMGSGVSSSASLEVAFFTFLEDLTKITVDPVKKAQLCQKAEHDFPGMPCGIMDQFIVTLGKKDHALLIDCRSLESKQVPMKCSDVVLLVVNSSVKHQLTGSEYPQRRAQCQQAADELGKPSLRSATIQDLSKLKCEELVLKRAKHVVEEITRTELVAQLLERKDYKEVGRLFYQSHESLSKLMEVSCPELDQLVDIMRSSDGVFGARMTGGGFGGCVIALIKKECLASLKSKVRSEYKGNPVFFECEPSDGARILKIG
ncbi:hypothetical protein KGM_215041 [Danaus plexippus plexippus]|uniref:Uncharacterized protein n=1 Tax=Danaus plexippus plexippus TaxID=278856 RepID=A0A212F634_DANPL|nr:hypothetical protein KGM_215041 [Danaus plexippus plexippus]